jgi:hypothetical protein
MKRREIRGREREREIDRERERERELFFAIFFLECWIVPFA